LNMPNVKVILRKSRPRFFFLSSPHGIVVETN
jgi:hypothetical protein